MAHQQHLSGFVRVLSERVMVHGAEHKVKLLMERVVHKVRLQPGFVRGDVLTEIKKPDIYIVLTEWESVKHLDKWLANAEYQKLVAEMDGILGRPVRYNVFHRQKEEVFLL